MRADPHDDHRAAGGEEVDDRREARLQDRRPDRRLEAPRRLAAEALELVVLAGIGLDHLDPAEALLQRGGDAPLLPAPLARGQLDPVRVPVDRDEERGAEGERHERELPVDDQHDRQDPEQGQHAGHEVHEHRDHDVLDAVDVGGQP